MTPDTIPFTAWEQAVFVVLFIVFVLALIGLLLKWFGMRDDKWQAFVIARDASHQDKWQEFIKARDEQWQRWMGHTDTLTAAALKEMTETLRGLTSEFSEHDKEARHHDRTTAEAIATMHERTANKPVSKPRAKAEVR